MFHDVRWIPDALDPNRFFVINQSCLEVRTLDKNLQSVPIKTIQYDVAGERHKDACCYTLERQRDDNPVAIGYSDGRICVVNPIKDDCVQELRNRAMCEQTRPIHKLSWSPTNPAWISAAQLKYRHCEPIVSFYDISKSSKKLRDLNSIYEISFCEGTDATWFPGTPETFGIGTKKSVQLFDLREKNKISEITVDGVLALTADPLEQNRFACVSRSGIRLYDRRYNHGKRPLHEFRFSVPYRPGNKVRRLMFHPRRLNNLSLVTRDSRILNEYIPTPRTYYDLKEHQIEKFNPKPTQKDRLLYFNRHVPFDRKIWSFDWHPQLSDRILLAFQDRTMLAFEDKQFVDFDIGDEQYAFVEGESLKVQEIEPEQEADEICILHLMKERVANGYGIAEGSLKLTDLISQCATVIASDETATEELRACWDWMSRVVHMDFSTDYGIKYNSSFPGALTVLHSLSGPDESVSEVNDQNKFIRRLKMRTKKHPRRDILLKLCGWPPIYRGDEIDAVDQISHELSQETSTATKAIAMAFFTCRSAKAKEYFDQWRNIPDPDLKKDFDYVRSYIDLSEISMDSQSSYHERIQDPYLSAIVLYIQTRLSYQNNLMQIIKLTTMSINDRIALAAIFMSDLELRRAVLEMQEESRNRLDGLLICGLGCHEACHKLLQGYTNRTGDIQTVSIILVATDCFFNGKEPVLHGVSSPFQTTVRSHVTVPELGHNTPWIRRSYCCIQDYFGLLNSWRMWVNRAYLASLLQCRLRVIPPRESQAVLACGFCGAQAFTDTTEEEDIAKSLMVYSGRMHQVVNANRVIPRTMACYSCRKPLPKCALCRFNIGSPVFVEDTQSPISHWFVWCTACHHGGHLTHVMSWFDENDVCVVPGCECCCRKRGHIESVCCLRDYDTSV